MLQNSAFSENESSTFLKVCINTEIDRYYEIFGGMTKLVTRDVSPTPGRPPSHLLVVSPLFSTLVDSLPYHTRFAPNVICSLVVSPLNNSYHLFVIDGWMDGWMDGQTNGRTGGHVGVRTRGMKGRGSI